MKILMRNIGMTLHVIHKLRERGITNVQVNMDWQHLIMNGESLGEYAAMLAAEGLLGHQHANSGWGTFDDDNMVGATAFMETLELAVELRRAALRRERRAARVRPLPVHGGRRRRRRAQREAVALHLGRLRAGSTTRRCARRSRARTRSAPTSSCTRHSVSRSGADRRRCCGLRPGPCRVPRGRRPALPAGRPIAGEQCIGAKEGLVGETMGSPTLALVGLDVGTTGVKAIARLARTGRCSRARRAASRSRRRSRAGRSRIPRTGGARRESALAEVAAGREVAGIGLSGQMHGLVVARRRRSRDPAGDSLERPAHRCRVRRDRGAGRARAADRADREPCAHRLHGAEASLAARATSRRRTRASRACMLPKDYVRLRLTGEWAIDAADASGTLLLDVAGRRWSEEVLDAARAPARLVTARCSSRRRSREPARAGARNAGRRRCRRPARCRARRRRSTGRGSSRSCSARRASSSPRSPGTPTTPRAASTPSVTPCPAPGRRWA